MSNSTYKLGEREMREMGNRRGERKVITSLLQPLFVIVSFLALGLVLPSLHIEAAPPSPTPRALDSSGSPASSAHASLSPGSSSLSLSPALFPVSYTIFFKEPPTVEGGSKEKIEEQRKQFYEELDRLGIEYRERLAYSGTLWSGVSLSLSSPAVVPLIARISVVKAVEKNEGKFFPLRRGGAGEKTASGSTLSSSSSYLRRRLGLQTERTEEKQEEQRLVQEREKKEKANNMPLSLPTWYEEGSIYEQISPHNVTQLREVHEGLGLRGKGIKIGLLDTGIDYTHPAFGSCRFIGDKENGCRVLYGRVYPGTGTMDGDTDPIDCNGHGTAVAGVLAGRDDKVIGVAPEAILGAYRVLGCKDVGLVTDNLRRAIEDAVADGMDIISLSLSSFNAALPSFPFSRIVSEAVAKGVIVMGAVGQEELPGLWKVTDPGVSPDVTAAAAVENQRYLRHSFELLSPAGRDGKDKEESVGEYDFFLPPELRLVELKDAELAVLTLDATVVGDACEPLANAQQQPLAGKLVLVRRGGCKDGGHLTKILHVQAAGAVGVIFYNVLSDPVNGSFRNMGAKLGIKIPYIHIGGTEGEGVVQRVLQGLGGGTERRDKDPSAGWATGFRIHFKRRDEPSSVANAGQFNPEETAWGLTTQLEIKPDISAPAGQVFTTWPISLGGYKTHRGTSLAVPYLSGAAALYLEAMRSGRFGLPELPAGSAETGKALRQFMQNTAVPMKVTGYQGYASVAVQGAGMINVFQLLTLKTLVSPASLALGNPRTAPITVRKQLTVRNHGPDVLAYQLTHEPAVAASSVDWGKKENPDVLDQPATVGFMPSSFTLKPQESLNVTVSITPKEELADQWLYSGYIKIKPNVGHSVFVPYAGFKGDYSAFKILEKGSVQCQNATSFQKPMTLSSETVFCSKEKGEHPGFILFLNRPTPLLTLTAYRIDEGKTTTNEGKKGERKLVEVGYVDYDESVESGERAYPRYRYPNDQFALYAGTADPGSTRQREIRDVPSGRYVVIARAEKVPYLMPDEDSREGERDGQEKAYEEWVSPEIVYQ